MTSEVGSGAFGNVAAEGDGGVANAGLATGSRYNQDDRTVRRLRFGVAAIGLLLPVVLPFGNWLFVQIGHHTQILPNSMSGSYYTSTRNILVGSLCALGVFLIGYRATVIQDWFTTVIGVFAILVATFPTVPNSPTHYQSVIGHCHLIFAIVLLLGLAAFCIASFDRETNANRETRNYGYLAAGILILVFLLAAVVAWATGWGSGWKLTPLYLCEALSVWSFGAAWLAAAIEIGRTLPSTARKTP